MTLILLYSQTLRDRGIEECFKYSSYHSEYTGAAALSVGESSIDFPSQLRRNTVSHFGPGSGLSVGKNGVVELNDVHHASDLQKGGSLLQSAAHDLMEANQAGWTKAWAPTLCTDFNNHDQSSSAISQAWKSCTDPAMKGCIWVRIFVPLHAHPSALLCTNCCVGGCVRIGVFIFTTIEVIPFACVCCVCVRARALPILTYTCTCIPKCIHIHVTYTHLHTHTYTYAYAYAHAYTYVHAHVHTPTFFVCFCGPERSCPVYLRRIP